MKTKILKLLALAAILAPACSRSPEKEMDAFVSDLMGEMTLEEKIGQLNLLSVKTQVVTGPYVHSDVHAMLEKGMVGGVLSLKGKEEIRAMQEEALRGSRLGIPLLFGLDVIHGYRTTFPIPLGMAATWDPASVESAARITAAEASREGLCWTFSPMVDIAHDARWGRIAEGAGEDPFLGAAMAQAYVKGYQGALDSGEGLLSCVKHFALYGAGYDGRDYQSVDMSRAHMFNYYMAPYESAVRAGAESVMTAFNDVEGVPVAGNKWLLDEVLRNRWGFGGLVVSDWNAVGQMVTQGMGDYETAAVKALQAGLDMDMVTGAYASHLQDALKKGRINRKMIDIACRRVLEAKYRLGLFDDPFRYCHGDSAGVILSPCHRAEARRIATESFVLLKNEGSLLPLNKKVRIAVTGPLADNKAEMLGTWSKTSVPEDAVTIVEGLRKACEGSVDYVPGSELCYDEKLQSVYSEAKLPRYGRPAGTMISEAEAIARGSDVIVVVAGECSGMSGEGASRSDISIPDAQRELLAAMRRTGKPVVLLLLTGRPLALEEESGNADAILNIWFPGTEAGDAVAEVLFGEVNPSGKLPVSFPRKSGHEPFFYNALPSGRPADPAKFKRFYSNWLDSGFTALYPFGYGLSYTTFEFGEIVLVKDTYSSREKIEAEVSVTNTGALQGTETVQWYIRDVSGSVMRPLKELKGFSRLSLVPGETGTARFSLPAEELGWYDNSATRKLEKGEFLLMAGPDSENLKEISFTIK